MRQKSILIVDDNPVNLKLVQVLLTLEGYEVRTATDASQVLTLLQSYRPDLILMDLQLPGVDGLELTRRLKADEETRSILIVIMTAYAMRVDKERALAAGCDGYLIKPIDTRTFPLLIAGYLNRVA